MTIFALLRGTVLGMAIGAALAAWWKIRGLTLACGVAAGGLGGFVVGLLCRTILPAGTLLGGMPLAIAGLGGVVAMFIAWVSIRKDQTSTT